jgi:hypothetical protein
MIALIHAPIVLIFLVLCLTSWEHYNLVLLEDKIYGNTYYNREKLPKTEELDQAVQMIKIYTNDDYLLYEVEK